MTPQLLMNRGLVPSVPGRSIFVNSSPILRNPWLMDEKGPNDTEYTPTTTPALWMAVDNSDPCARFRSPASHHQGVRPDRCCLSRCIERQSRTPADQR